jgi:phosphoribosylamine--glycine ligase
MKVLVVGNGGREHALAWKIRRSPLVKELFIAPGNAGTREEGTNVEGVAPDDVPRLVALAKEKAIDLVVVGPEAPLVKGLVDALTAERILAFGPSQQAAELEGSKAYTKRFLARHRIPTAEYGEFTKLDEALAYVRARPQKLQVVKADGLAAGKGVVVCDDLAQAESALGAILGEKAFGAAGARVVVEERLIGVEVSCLAIADGTQVLPLATARDHKRAFDGDQGPNTGGMGAYSPAPDVTPDIQKKILERILRPTIDGMRTDGRPYRGVLYAGIMLVEGEPLVLEFNARFGDPETQPLLFRMTSDLLPALIGSARGALEGATVAWDSRASACVVMAAGGYPADVKKGDVIEGLDAAKSVADTHVFHAGTALKDGRVVTNGGRVLGVTALGDDVRAAALKAYEACTQIRWDGARYRKDIGVR